MEWISTWSIWWERRSHGTFKSSRLNLNLYSAIFSCENLDKSINLSLLQFPSWLIRRWYPSHWAIQGIKWVNTCQAFNSICFRGLSSGQMLLGWPAMSPENHDCKWHTSIGINAIWSCAGQIQAHITLTVLWPKEFVSRDLS